MAEEAVDLEMVSREAVDLVSLWIFWALLLGKSIVFMHLHISVFTMDVYTV
jgi:hypothetical protein